MGAAGHPMCLILVLLTSSMSTNQIAGQFYAPGMPEKEYVEDGDINLGGLFPIYGYSRSLPCGSKLRTTSILQYIEAMVYAIKEINNSTDILPNVKLGFAIMDTCVKESTALAQTLKFLPEYTADDITTTPTTTTENGDVTIGQHGNDSHSTCVVDKTEQQDNSQRHDVVGIVGAMKSSCSAQVATLCAPFHLPQISYSSTADSLSDKATYPYFSRLVPPDKFQVAAMVDFMRAMNWSYISLLYDSTEYGQSAYRNLKVLSKTGDWEICIAYSSAIGEATTEKEYDLIVEKLVENARARAVVLFAGPASTRGVFAAVIRANATGRFIWIGSEAWGVRLSQLQGLESAFKGAFTFRPYFKRVDKFHNYFKKLNPVNNKNNPWFAEFWEYAFGCSWTNDTTTEKPVCDPAADLSSIHKPLAIAPVLDSVYTFAVALDQVLRRNPDCKDRSGDILTSCITGASLLAEVRKSHFNGHSGMVAFDENGDMLGTYLMEQVQVDNGNIEQVAIAIWDAASGNLAMKDAPVVWYLQDSEGPGSDVSEGRSELPPESVCSHPCGKHEFYIQKELSCCWECRECRPNEILVKNATDCRACEEYTWPDETFRACVTITAEYIKWGDSTAILLVVFSIIGIFSTIAVIGFYIGNRHNKLIKASSRELSYLMLVGILLGYATVFGFVSTPRDGTCIGIHFAFSLGFAWIYGPLLTRTNRIFRIFDSGKKSQKRPPLIGQRAQMTIAMSLIFLQVLITVTCVAVQTPKAQPIMPLLTEKYVELSCEFSKETLVTFVASNLVLITFCTFYAFKTRKLPDNYNESRYISLCVYTTLVIWVAFIPSYFSTPRAYYKVTLLSLALLLNDSVALGFLFLPKVYALIWASEEAIAAAGSSQGSNALGTRSTALTTQISSSRATGLRHVAVAPAPSATAPIAQLQVREAYHC